MGSPLTMASFRANFDGTAVGTLGLVTPMGGMGGFDQCNAQIGGQVTDTQSHLGIDAVGVTLTGGILGAPKKANTALDGTYVFSGLCFGTYSVEASTPTGYTPSGASSTSVPLDDNESLTINFGFSPKPVVSTAYTTFGQGAWGAKPKGKNAGKILADFFALVYPSGEVEVGIPDTVGRFSVTLTGPEAVTTFLPQGGLPRPLDRSYVDPPSMWKVKHKGKFKHHFMISQ